MTASPSATAPPPLSALVVDDDPQIVALFSQILGDASFVVSGASDVGSAYEALGKQQFDIAILDLNMPGGSGLDIVDAISRTSPGTAVMLVSAVSDRQTAASARERGAEAYLVKPVTPRQLLIGVDDLVSRRETSKTRRLEDRRILDSDAFERLVRISAVRDAETGNHSGRMSRLCKALALAVGLGEAQADAIGRASLLHDIGKIAIADGILHKPGPLNVDERRQIEKHPAIGWTLLSGSADPLLDLAATIALCHHERWDGAGYPHGLAGDEIPLEARIAAVCDVYDALTSARPYREALPSDQALEIMIERNHGAFDPRIVEAFMRMTAIARDSKTGLEAAVAS